MFVLKMFTKNIKRKINDETSSNDELKTAKVAKIDELNQINDNCIKDEKTEQVDDNEQKNKRRQLATNSAIDIGMAEIANKKQQADTTVNNGLNVEETLQREEKVHCNNEYWKLALPLYTRLIEAKPEAKSYCDRCACYIQLERYEEALVDAEKSVEFDANFTEGYMNIVKCSIALGILPKADSALTKLARIDPNNKLIVREQIKYDAVMQNLKESEVADDANDFSKALMHLDKCLEISTHCLFFKIEKSDLLVALQRYEEAEKLAREIFKDDKSNIAAKYIIQFCTEKLDRHTQELLRLIPDAESLDMYKNVKSLLDVQRDGHSAFEGKQYVKAHEIYLKALEIDSTNRNHTIAELYYNLALASYKLGHICRCIDECEKVLTIDENHVNALQQKGECHLKLDEYQQAIDDLTKAYDLEPHAECEKLLNEAKRLLEAFNSSIEAARLFTMKNYDEALAAAKKSVDLNPKLIEGYTNVAESALVLGRLQDVASALTQLVHIDPDNESIVSVRRKCNEVQQNLKNAYEAQAANNFSESLIHLNQCLQISTHSKLLKMKKCDLLVTLEQFKEAKKVARNILTKDKSNCHAKFIIGLCIYHCNVKKSVSYFQELLHLIPEDTKSLDIYTKAQNFVALFADANKVFYNGDYKKAYNLYTNALKIDLNNKNMMKKLYFNRSLALYQLKDFCRSIGECTKALAFDSNYIKALRLREKSYMEIKEYELAVSDLSRICGLKRHLEYKELLRKAMKLLRCVKPGDYHGILGVKRNASENEMREMMRKKALIHHPDRHCNSSPAARAFHERRMKEITQAYRLLTQQ